MDAGYPKVSVSLVGLEVASVHPSSGVTHQYFTPTGASEPVWVLALNAVSWRDAARHQIDEMKQAAPVERCDAPLPAQQ